MTASLDLTTAANTPWMMKIWVNDNGDGDTRIDDQVGVT